MLESSFLLVGTFSPILDIIWQQLYVFRNEHQPFLYEHSLWPIFQVVHHLVTGTRHNFTQLVDLLRPHSISGSLVLVIVFFSRLQQIVIQSILRKCVFWRIVLSIDQRNFLQSNRVLRFDPSQLHFCVIKSVYQSIQMLNPS